MMQDVVSKSPVPTEMTLRASISSSDISRLSVGTVMPNESPHVGREVERRFQQIDNDNFNACLRSRSLQSQDSNTPSSSIDTEDVSSSFDNVDGPTLQRNSSWASTIPTSPETEASIGHIPSLDKEHLGSAALSSSSNAILPTIRSLGPAISNRNKPLPVPHENSDTEVVIDNAVKTISCVPHLSVEPGSDCLHDDAMGSAADISPSLPSSEEGSSSRRSLKQIMGKSSQLFRRSTDSRGTVLPKSPKTPSRQKSYGLSAKESFSWFYRSLPPSPNTSVIDLPLQEPQVSSSAHIQIHDLATQGHHSVAARAGLGDDGIQETCHMAVRPSLYRNGRKAIDLQDDIVTMARCHAETTTRNPFPSPQHDSIAVGTTSILEVELPASVVPKEPSQRIDCAQADNRGAEKPLMRERRASAFEVVPSFSPHALRRRQHDMHSSRRHSRSGSSGMDDDFRSALSSAFTSFDGTQDDLVALSPSKNDNSTADGRLVNLPCIQDDNSERSCTDKARKSKKKQEEESKDAHICATLYNEPKKTGSFRDPHRKGATDGATSKSRPKSAILLDTCEEQQHLMKLEEEKNGKGQRRPSQATLSIVDDVEFLQALENVRKIHQERIQRREEMANRVTRMARMGMASGNKRSGRGRGKRVDDVNTECANRHARRVPLQRRSSSADARYPSTELKTEAALALRSSQERVTGRDVHNQHLSALELGVGKASGKLQDGAFINDDDWKREVKALFVIRELVMTERSYARHLEALLHAIRSHYSPSRRMSVNSSTNRQSGQFPPHFLMMRNLLPQLIALSRSLANHIDENPTAAGVGAAFRAVHSQMEANFIAWSSSVKEIMAALRGFEKPKSKSVHRIGLITLSSLDDDNIDKEVRDVGSVSVPTSPRLGSSKFKRLSNGHSRSQSNTRAPSPTRSILEDHKNEPILQQHKRRSTFSGLGPPLLLPPKSPQGLGRRAFEVVVSSSRPIFATQTKNETSSSASTSASASPVWSSKRLTTSSITPMTSSSGHLCVEPDSIDDSGRNALSPTAHTSKPLKRLSALDVAIMPTQRLPRYLLLLRDLNMNTPPQSLSHVRLQRSLDMLITIAQRCNEASK